MSVNPENLFRKLILSITTSAVLAAAVSVPLLARAEALGKDAPPPQLEPVECPEQERPLQKPGVRLLPPNEREGCDRLKLDGIEIRAKGGLKIKLGEGRSEAP